MNRLRELQRAEKLTQQELADIAEVSKRTIQNWEDGTSNIKPKKAEKLADYFGVSVGYLLGYDDNDFEKQIRIDTLNDIINQMNRLKELRKEKKLTQKELAEKTDIPYRTLQRWENGETDIKSDRLKKLCEIFDVDAPYLLGYNNVKNETDIKASVLDEALEKLRAINNMVSVESDEDPNMWTVGFLTAIAAIESFKKEIEAQKDE